MEDQEMIDLYFARNEDAIAQTAAAYGKRLFALAEHIVRNRQDAEENVSDTYWKAWDSIPPQRPQRFFAYLAKICRHLALDKLDWRNASNRKAEIISLTEEMEQCIPDIRLDAELEGKELSLLLDGFLRTLSAENRMVFMRRYWYADPIAEIAERYGISVGAVQMRLNRTKEKLYTYLEKEGISI